MTLSQDLKAIKKKLKELGFKIDDEDTNFGDSNDSYTLINTEYEIESFNITFSKDQLPHCCGVIEIGDIRISNLTYYNKKDAFFEEAILLTRYAFLHQKQININKVRVGKALIFCGNGKYSSKIAELALLDASDHYKLVSQHINNGSRNKISVFITT